MCLIVGDGCGSMLKCLLDIFCGCLFCLIGFDGVCGGIVVDELYVWVCDCCCVVIVVVELNVFGCIVQVQWGQVCDGGLEVGCLEDYVDVFEGFVCLVYFVGFDL